MHENRTRYPKKKTAMYQQLQEIPKKYRVLAIIKMDKVRSTQILPLRKILKGQVEFVSIKDKIAKKAFGVLLDVPGIKEMVSEFEGQCMCIFTNMSPFKLNVLLAKNKIMMAARGGDVASVDIVVPAKNTGIAPGPMLTEFKEAGIPTKIDQGTIWIAKDSTPVLKGEAVNEKLAIILGKLDIKPVEAGIVLYCALEDGVKYAESEMVVDIDKIRESIILAHQESVTLSVEAGYVTDDNVLQIIGKAAQSAVSVAVEAGYMTEQTREQVLQRAHAHAKAVADRAENYTAN